MARFETSPNLFGTSGAGTDGDIDCDWCGKQYTGREDEDGRGVSESISYTRFGRLQVCDCCFEEIENEILHRIDDIIPWLIRIIEARKKYTAQQEAAIARLRRVLQDI